MKEYAKAIFALVGALATWGATAASDGVYDAIELWTLLGVVGTAVGVYVVPNKAPEDDEEGHYDTAGLVVTTAVAIVVWVVLYFLVIK